MTFSERLSMHRFKADLNLALWGEKNPRCIFPRRPSWWQTFLMQARLPWCAIHAGDTTLKVWYALEHSFLDACIWVQIKRGKIKP